MRKLMKSESGQSIILIALALTVLLVFGAVTIDIGAVTLKKAKLQSAIDAAALAGAQSLPDTAAATSAAQAYAQKNGFLASDIKVTFSDSNTRINVSATKAVPYTFAQVLGIASTTVENVSSAKKQQVSGGTISSPAFNYMIVSGSQTSDLRFANGYDSVINGSIHTNANLYIGQRMTITGKAETSKSITAMDAWTLDNSTIPNKIENAPKMTMPTIPVPDAPTGVTWTNSLPASVNITSPIYFNGDFTFTPGGTISITGNGCIIATGNVFLGGGAPITVNTTSPTAIRSINGSVTIGNTLNLIGTGNIIAKQDITIQGGPMTVKCTQQPCLQAEQGDIWFGNTVTLDGVVFAPNGEINLKGGTHSLKGSMIGDRFVIENTINFTGTSGTGGSINGSGSTTYQYKLVE